MTHLKFKIRILYVCISGSYLAGNVVPLSTFPLVFFSGVWFCVFPPPNQLLKIKVQQNRNSFQIL